MGRGRESPATVWDRRAPGTRGGLRAAELPVSPPGQEPSRCPRRGRDGREHAPVGGVAPLPSGAQEEGPFARPPNLALLLGLCVSPGLARGTQPDRPPCPICSQAHCQAQRDATSPAHMASGASLIPAPHSIPISRIFHTQRLSRVHCQDVRIQGWPTPFSAQSLSYLLLAAV